MYGFINYSGIGSLTSAGGIDIYYKNKLKQVNDYLFFTKENTSRFDNKNFWTRIYLNFIRSHIKNFFYRSHFDWYFQLYYSLKTHRKDLEYVEVPDSFGYGIVLHILKIPYEVKLHTPHSVVVDLNVWRKDRYYYIIKFLEKKAIKYASKIVSPSKAMIDYLNNNKWNIKGSELFILNNGYHGNFYTSLEDFKKLVKRKKQILFVGNLEPRKNLIFLLKNFLSNTIFANYSLLICGIDSYMNLGKGKEYNSYWNYCLAQVPNIKDNERIKYLGFIENDNLQSLYRESEFFIITSSKFENFPTVVLEAFFYQTIVIGSMVGGIPELIEDSVNGFLFKDNDQEDFLKTFKRAMNCDHKEIQEHAKRKLEKINLQEEKRYVL